MEPERHIEKLLRDVAKKRREQAGEPFALHPAARQELLREASRPAAKKSGGFFAQMFSGFGPRLAVALSAVVVVVVGVWLARPLLSRKQNTSALAMANLSAVRPALQNEPAPATAPPPESAAPAVATPTREAFAENATPTAGTRRSSTDEALKTKAPTSPTIAVNSALSQKEEANRKLAAGVESPKPVGAAQPSVALNDLSKSVVAPTPSSTPVANYKDAWATDSLAAGNADKASSSSASSVATNAVAPAMTFAAADREAQKKLNGTQSLTSVNTGQMANFDATVNTQIAGRLTPLTQNFNRVIIAPTMRQRGFGGSGGAAPLLASFKMEQNGQEIRVVDADGSVYTGSWQVAPEQNLAPAAGRAGGLHFSGATPAASSVRPAPAAENNFQPVQNYFFSVSGTNRNLNQRITFSGNLIPLANVFTSNNASAVGGLNAATLNVAPPVLLNSRIAGRAIIGNREIEVNANPAR
jgi:hypothetical protein